MVHSLFKLHSKSILYSIKELTQLNKLIPVLSYFVLVANSEFLAYDESYLNFTAKFARFELHKKIPFV